MDPFSKDPEDSNFSIIVTLHDDFQTQHARAENGLSNVAVVNDRDEIAVFIFVFESAKKTASYEISEDSSQ